MADESLLQKIHELGDLDLAALLCLLGREHCIISTSPAALDDLIAELHLVASRTFGLTSVTVDCTPQTTLDQLAAAIQLPPATQPTSSGTPRSTSPLRTRADSYFHAHPGHYSHSNNHTHNHSNGGGGAATTTSHPQYPHQHAHAHTRIHNGRTVRSPLTGNHSSTSPPPQPQPPSPTPQIANVILARNLDRAPKVVQIQCLELLRTRRIFTRTSVLPAPKRFLFVAVLGEEGGGRRLTAHLNDFMYISHYHDPEDGFMHLDQEEEEEGEGRRWGGRDERTGNTDAEEEDNDDNDDDASSTESVVHRSAMGTPTPTPTPGTPAFLQPGGGFSSAAHPHPQQAQSQPQPPPPPQPYRPQDPPPPLLPDPDLTTLSLAASSSSVQTDIEVQRYQMNLIAFLRLHRAVAGSGSGSCISPTATRHLRSLSRQLAALHGLPYVTPAVVVLALRKVYAHRIRVLGATTDKNNDDEDEDDAGEDENKANNEDELARERSVQWGGDVRAVKKMLQGVGPEDVLEDVLGLVAAPL
ncbi:hypothetical protein F4778DRAFT_730781 [Xylariomycetidae sp. FL2044]|nr:hypothetical protein F4778DRAFT_730781 [Xylariomycetidae sp. FL2044]